MEENENLIENGAPEAQSEAETPQTQAEVPQFNEATQPETADGVLQEETPQGAVSLTGTSNPQVFLGTDGRYYTLAVQSAPAPVIPRGFTAASFEEYKGIKRQATAIGAALLFLTVIPFFFRNLIISLLALPRVREIVGSPFFNDIYGIVVSVLLFTLPFIFFAKVIGKQKLSSIAGYNRPKKGTAFCCVFLGLAFCAFAQIATAYLEEFFDFLGPYNFSYGENLPGVAGFIITVLSTAVAPALVEEFACRGIIFGSLKKYGEGFAVVASAIVFGVMHGNFEQIPFAFLVGLILGYIRVVSGSVLVCCIVHGLNNLVSVVGIYLYEIAPARYVNLGQEVFWLLCIVFGIVAFLSSGAKKDFYTLPESSCELSVDKKFKAFFTSPMIIIFIAANLVLALQYFSSF